MLEACIYVFIYNLLLNTWWLAESSAKADPSHKKQTKKYKNRVKKYMAVETKRQDIYMTAKLKQNSNTQNKQKINSNTQI